MKKLISLCLISFLLTGCFLRVHKMDIAQGNIFTQEEIAKLHTGMSETQVRQVLGNPVLINIFDKNRTDYIYTYQPAYGAISIKRLTLIFSSGRLQSILRD